jgi:sugar (pentulose or hexulose) kinase
MLTGRVVVLDVGKTLAKLSLWDAQGRMLAQRVSANRPLQTSHGRALEAVSIERWLATTLAEFARMGPVSAIVPVAHGAAVAVIGRGCLACPVPDYEEALPEAMLADYRASRDAFALTGSPALPNGLNLGAQLHRLEALYPGLLSGEVQLLPWPQYWAWRLCGVAASEVTSLGCHSDLWQPAQRTHSPLARRRGWAERLAPLRRADEVLGALSAEWSERTGLSPEVQVLCGLHDSNAALLAARGFPEIGTQEATVLSTGTWFVAMRSPAVGAEPDLAGLPEARDCLVNVDVHSRPIPSARFMGGREIEALGGFGPASEPATLAALPGLLASGAMVLPGWAPGVGPFPRARGGWVDEPADPARRRAAQCLYLGLMADVALGLIGARARIFVEGRFAESEVLVRALASLRPDTAVYTGGVYEGVPCGALRLVDPGLSPPSTLHRVEPLHCSLDAYRAEWLRRAAQAQAA